MPLQIVTDGQDPLTSPVLGYLEGMGVPTRLIKRIQVDSTVGDVQLVTVTLMVDKALLADPSEPHVWQEYNEHGNTCHRRGCTLAELEHVQL